MSSISRCNNEVTELTWQNGQISVHGVGEASCKPQTWGLESIVHQATATFNAAAYPDPQPYSSTSSMPIGNWDLQQDGNPSMHADQQIDRGSLKASSKRVRSESAKGFPAEESASATFCRDRDTDTTMMTWNSFDSPRSLKTTRIADDDSVVYLDCSENRDGERIPKGESCRSQSSARRSRAAAIHNLSERRRRDRINEKMKALQKLVPNASKTDKASMLDEVIEYLKQLQAQVNMMSINARNMPQMVMPMAMLQQLQMSLLARMGLGMGMGMGMGMLDVNNLARNVHPSFPPPAAATPFVSPPFAMPPPVVPPPKPNADASAPVPNFNDAYNTFLAQQSMNMEFLNKMSALYRQQSSSQQPSKKPVTSLSLPNDAPGG